MKLVLYRKWFFPDRTIGELWFDFEEGEGLKFHSYTMEDQDRGLTDEMSEEEIRKIKVPEQTCIPYCSRKPVVWVMSPSRKVFTLRVLEVKGFQGILFHSGNDPGDTAGCILVGFIFDEQQHLVLDSRRAVQDLEKKVCHQLDLGKKVFLHILKVE